MSAAVGLRPVEFFVLTEADPRVPFAVCRTDRKDATPVSADEVGAATADVRCWLSRPAESSLLTVRITDAAVPWL
jgi:hypothetical protein